MSKLVDSNSTFALQYAKEKNVRVMVDAEQSYFQPAIRRIVLQAMKRYNREMAIIFNTYQCYLTVSFILSNFFRTACTDKFWDTVPKFEGLFSAFEMPLENAVRSKHILDIQQSLIWLPQRELQLNLMNLLLVWQIDLIRISTCIMHLFFTICRTGSPVCSEIRYFSLVLYLL